MQLPIILASASPRRAELLRRAGIDFTVQVSPHREPHRKPAGIPIDLWPMCLAYIKAAAVQSRISNLKSQIILGADTIVVEGARILNKARNRAHARLILASLHNKPHRVITGVCLLSADDKHQRLFAATATCRLHLSGKKLDAYLDSNLWKGKAGAYGIQDDHDPFVTLIDGDIDTVIGLPTELVKRELADFAELLHHRPRTRK